MERAREARTYLSQLVDTMVKMFNRRNGCLLIGLSIVILGMDGSIKSVNTMELMIDLQLLSHGCSRTLHSSDNSHQEPPNRCLVCRSKGWMIVSIGPYRFRSIVDGLLCKRLSFQFKSFQIISPLSVLSSRFWATKIGKLLSLPCPKISFHARSMLGPGGPEKLLRCVMVVLTTRFS